MVQSDVWTKLSHLLPHTFIETDRGVELLHHWISRTGESSAPELVPYQQSFQRKEWKEREKKRKVVRMCFAYEGTTLRDHRYTSNSCSYAPSSSTHGRTRSNVQYNQH